MEIFSQSYLLLLFRLTAAHMIADVMFRPHFWEKLRDGGHWFSKRRLAQGAAAGILTYVCAASWGAVWLPFVILVSRTLLDGLKYKKEKTVLFFFINLMGHIVIILCCWLVLVSDSITDITAIICSITSNVKLWALTFCYIAVIWPAGVWIGKITEPWREELKEPDFQGLEKAGLWIGRLERILILTFVLLSRYEAIGFLIAAKSIFRFEEIKTSKNRKEVEYILIGTMLSFVIAIFIGIIATWFLQKLSVLTTFII